MVKTDEVEVDFPAAFSFLNDPPLGAVRYRVSYGGRGSAKSWQFARALLLRGVEQPLRILCTREFQASIRDSVHRLLADQIDTLGLGGFYNVEQRAITGRNGTEFLFKGLRHDIKQIKSTEAVDICWVEEAEATSDESWRVLIPTIRKPKSEIWVSFNPALETDPTYKRFIADPPSRSLIRRVSWKDNPWLPEVLKHEKDELFRKDPEAYVHVWEGEPWTRSDSQVLADKWVVEEFKPRELWDGPYFGADFGFARDPAVLVKLWIGDSKLWVEYDEHGVQLDMDDLERSWRRVPDAGEYTIRADSARPETINEMRKRGLKCEAAPKWDGSVKDGIEHLRSYEQIVIHPRCKLAITEARLWRYKTDPRTGDVIPKLEDSHDHTWDAARYGLSPMIRHQSRPRFSTTTAAA